MFNSDCLESDLAGIKSHWVSLCASCCTASKLDVYRATLAECEEDVCNPSQVAQELRDAFFAVTGSEIKSAKLFFRILCKIVRAYSCPSGTGLTAYLDKIEIAYPDLAKVLLKNFDDIFICYLE